MEAPTGLIDAVLRRLRSSNAAAAFGDTFDPDVQTGIQKFGAEFVVQPDLPWMVIHEPGEKTSYFTAGAGQALRPYLAEGTLSVEVVAGSRDQARRLGDLVVMQLHDAPLVWMNAAIMLFRLQSSHYASTPDAGPGSPAVFVRVLTFTFMYQGGV